MAWVDGLLPAVLFVVWAVGSFTVMVVQVVIDILEKRKREYRRTHHHKTKE